MSPEAITPPQQEILAAWEQVPEDQQLATLLMLLGRVMESEQGPKLQEEIATHWPLETTFLHTTFPVVQIARDDLARACFSEDEIAQLDDEELENIGQTMRAHYVHDVFWPELEYVVTDLLEKKQTQSLNARIEKATAADKRYYEWMSQIDRYIWQLLGCSLYDLPDFDSRSMFENGLEATEVANVVINQAGLLSNY